MTSGRIGKFGWKAQTTDLRGFVLAACANELGLEAPGHGQAVSPLKPDTRARALDLTQEECDALVAYVKALPAPIQLDGPDDFAIKAGRASFEEIGCADCHRPSLGDIDGIYSDLLMHDMGPELTSVAMTLVLRPDRAGRYPDVLQPGRWVGVAHAPALGIPRLRPVSPRRSRPQSP